MPNAVIIGTAAVLLVGLLYCEGKERQGGRLVVKTVLSLLFLLTVLIQPHPLPRYYHLLLIGLICCLGGDVFLALPQEKMFRFGLISFLWGHVFFILAFFAVANVTVWTWVGSIIGLMISGGVFLWLRPHLGSMEVPVLFYVLVITIMLVGAWSILGDSGLDRIGRVMAFAGAVSFYFSDIFVARDRFLKRAFFNRLLGLPLYYTGQFLLAFSVGLLR